MRVDGSRVRKEKVVDSKIARFVDEASLDDAGKLGYTNQERIHSDKIKGK